MGKRFDFQDSKDSLKIFLEAIEVLAPPDNDSRIVRDEKGDVTFAFEKEGHKKLAEALEKRGVHALVISENGQTENSKGGEYDCITFLDPLEGSTNYKSGTLPFGTNLVAFPYKEIVEVSDWRNSIVVDWRNSLYYVAHRDDDKKDTAYVIDNGVKRPPRRNGKIIEIPIGYTDDDNTIAMLMRLYNVLKDELDTNQYRSIDVTGPEIASIIYMVYIEGRDLDKLGPPWDIIPAAVIVNAAGGYATHIDGKPFDDDVVWNPKKFKNGYNPHVANDILAAMD
ncbi:MAG: hypothetical protein GXO64_00675, partial [Candidatus Micrarchaeota archaeon]|nr:hypothetical protein [Candidatus Micrarchaeota archaeon]